MTSEQPIQRLRVVFSIGQPVKYISHLDLMRAWERALRRAQVGLSYSQGFNPRPKLVFAAALPVGFTAQAEIVDVYLEKPMKPEDLAAAVEAQLPAGLKLVGVTEVPQALPSLPSQVSAAEYRVAVSTDEDREQVQRRIDRLLASDSLHRVRERPGGGREYDLRPLIQKLWLADSETGEIVIGMLLQASARGTGRPDEVMAELGMAQGVRAIRRLSLGLAAG